MRRLRAAGAVIFGKTNTPTLAGDWQTYNPIFGTTNNPWDTDAHHRRVVGRGRGGGRRRHDGARAGQRHRRLDPHAVELVRGVRPQADVGRRSATRVTCRLRRARSPTTDLNVMGPIARDVDDLELALGVLAGAAGHAAVGWRLELPAPRGTTLGDLRLALWLDDPAYPVEPEVGDVLGVGGRRAAGRRCPADRDPAGRRPAGGGPGCISSCSIRFCCAPWRSERFDKLDAMAQHCPHDDDGPLARTARFAPSATATGCSPTSAASSCAP